MTQRRIYQCAFPYHITFNISYREWFFEKQEKAEILHEIILNAGDIKNHIVYQFCIMPDHVHMLCKTEWKDGTQRTQRRLENLHCVGVTDCVGVMDRVGGADCADGTDCVRGLDMKDTPVFCNEGFPTCVVKNHCDVKNPHNISDYIKSVKGTFSRTIHMGRIWQPRFHDEIIETDGQLLNIIPYITNNPVKAKLPEKYQKHPYQYYNQDLIEKLMR